MGKKWRKVSFKVGVGETSDRDPLKSNYDVLQKPAGLLDVMASRRQVSARKEFKVAKLRGLRKPRARTSGRFVKKNLRSARKLRLTSSHRGREKKEGERERVVARKRRRERERESSSRPAEGGSAFRAGSASTPPEARLHVND